MVSLLYSLSCNLQTGPRAVRILRPLYNTTESLYFSVCTYKLCVCYVTSTEYGIVYFRYCAVRTVLYTSGLDTVCTVHTVQYILA
jgi:hypothetical protein